VDDVGAAAFRAAEGMIGTPFRSQGRHPVHGLDCVGVIWAAYRAVGVPLVPPEGYPLRGWSFARVEAALRASGLVRCGDAARMGDVLLCDFGAGQFHLGLSGTDRVIHAHAGLRLVVDAPFDALWDGAAVWRLAAGDVQREIA
jgi:cell wall-associated NlpC family hydrolase